MAATEIQHEREGQLGRREESKVYLLSSACTHHQQCTPTMPIPPATCPSVSQNHAIPGNAHPLVQRYAPVKPKNASRLRTLFALRITFWSQCSKSTLHPCQETRTPVTFFPHFPHYGRSPFSYLLLRSPFMYRLIDSILLPPLCSPRPVL